VKEITWDRAEWPSLEIKSEKPLEEEDAVVHE
jgi:hypothetical protein